MRSYDASNIYRLLVLSFILNSIQVGQAISTNPGYLKLRKIRAAQNIARTVIFQIILVQIIYVTFVYFCTDYFTLSIDKMDVFM